MTHFFYRLNYIFDPHIFLVPIFLHTRNWSPHFKITVLVLFPIFEIKNGDIEIEVLRGFSGNFIVGDNLTSSGCMTHHLKHVTSTILS